jgi:uncharacterized protein
MTQDFSPFVAEQLRYYVYLLRDPRDGKVFYVGKGVANRVFAHALDALDEQGAGEKLDRIRAIRAEGKSVRYELLRGGGGGHPTAWPRRAAQRRRWTPRR